ncbi:hypothetical protein [Bradyrhizobium sp.]|jgi:hypothetical protein|uniref:hypothetical protein n=1 Tax=Bradyrhizobium sp. TaxID=376 RepID=UPI002E01A318|nr:hypothetical protein [Bradyrhizobium sp.]
MPIEVSELKEIEGFRAVLINLSDGVTDSTLDLDLVAKYLHEISTTSGDRKSAHFHNLLRLKMMNIVFADIDRYQRLASLSKPSGTQLATFRGLNSLAMLIESHKDLKESLADDGALLADNYNTSDPSADVSADECRQLAKSINRVCSQTEEFFLALGTPGGRKRLVWFTDLANLTGRFGALPEINGDAYAYELRNWLGLGHVNFGEHLFGFISTAKDVCGTELARPTVFDGIDNLWFKHLRGAGSYDDDAGRALNLDSLQTPAGPFDGGWEAVTPGPKFSGQFKCHYIGRITPPATVRTADRYDEELVLRALLSSASTARSFDDVVTGLGARIP